MGYFLHWSTRELLHVSSKLYILLTTGAQLAASDLRTAMASGSAAGMDQTTPMPGGLGRSTPSASSNIGELPNKPVSSMPTAPQYNASNFPTPKGWGEVYNLVVWKDMSMAIRLLILQEIWRMKWGTTHEGMMILWILMRIGVCIFSARPEIKQSVSYTGAFETAPSPSPSSGPMIQPQITPPRKSTPNGMQRIRSRCLPKRWDQVKSDLTCDFDESSFNTWTVLCVCDNRLGRQLNWNETYGDDT